MNTNKNKNSLLNAVTAMGLTLTNGLFGIVVTRFIIGCFGSDFNGLNSTANQIVNVLMIIEGGFTLASNVALFAPLSDKDYTTVNGILSATKKKFKKISLIFLAVGLVAAAVYAFIANSSLPREFIGTLIVMTVIPAAFNLFLCHYIQSASAESAKRIYHKYNHYMHYRTWAYFQYNYDIPRRSYVGGKIHNNGICTSEQPSYCRLCEEKGTLHKSEGGA